MIFERRVYFSVALILVALAIFSCTVRQFDTSEITPELAENEELLPLPPITRADRARSAAPVVEVDAQGPQGPFSEFQKVTADTLANLPRAEDVRARPDFDAHQSPAELMAISPSLGRIATTLREAPELIPQGIEFYDACARREDILQPVRVLCLRNLTYWTRQMPEVMQVDPSKYPDELWDIVESLPPVTR